MSRVSPIQTDPTPPTVQPSSASQPRGPPKPRDIPDTNFKPTSAKAARILKTMRRDQEDRGPKRQAIVFLVVTGLLVMAGGGALTWVAVHTQLHDFFILGPGGLAIGFILIAFAAMLVVREWLKRRRRRQQEEQKAAKEQELAPLNDYHIPQLLPALPHKQPVKSELYGTDDPVRARRVSVFMMNDAKIVPSKPQSASNPSSLRPVSDEVAPFYEKELGALPPPSVTYPQTVTETLQDKQDTVYRMPLKERGRSSTMDSEVSCGTAASNASVYEPDTRTVSRLGSPSGGELAPVYEPAPREERTVIQSPKHGEQRAATSAELYELVTGDGGGHCSQSDNNEQSEPGANLETHARRTLQHRDTDDMSVHSQGLNNAVQSGDSKSSKVTEV